MEQWQHIMINKIVDNFFSDEEINRIKDIIANNIDKLREDDPGLGRDRLDLGKELLGQSIINKLNNYAQSFKKSYSFNGCYYAEYNLKYGNPELPMHTDQTRSVFTLDYQLDANITWPICVEGKSFILKNNQALSLNVVEQLHWRPKQIFNQGEYVRMIFFHFLDKDNLNPKILNREEMSELAKKWDYI